MVSLPLYDETGKETGKFEGDEGLFSAAIKNSVIHSALVWYLASIRQGTASTKTRSEVRGGGKKPWKQKGTGRARAGSIRSPLWRGGGVMFGPKPRDYSFALPKKVRKLAIKMAVSDKAQSGKIKILEKIDVKEAKTKNMAEILKKMALDNALLVLDSANAKVKKAVANIKKVKLTSSKDVKLFDILKYDWLVIDKDAVSSLTVRLSQK